MSTPIYTESEMCWAMKKFFVEDVKDFMSFLQIISVMSQSLTVQRSHITQIYTIMGKKRLLQIMFHIDFINNAISLLN